MYLDNFNYDHQLTEAFRGQLTPISKTAVFLKLRDLAVLSDDGIGLEGRHMIVVRRVIDKTKIALLLISLSVASPGVGTLVGMYSRNAQVGIAVSAGIFALASFILELTAWLVA